MSPGRDRRRVTSEKGAGYVADKPLKGPEFFQCQASVSIRQKSP